MLEVWKSNEVISHSKLLYQSYLKWTGKKLISDFSNEVQLSEQLYHASFVVVSHGTEQDPLFNYANLTAQQLWKIDWQEFVGMPSRYSAEPMAREEREKLLKEASDNGYVSGYEGIRICSDQKRFQIKDTLLWNLIDEQQQYKGQAAMFDRWRWL